MNKRFKKPPTKLTQIKRALREPTEKEIEDVVKQYLIAEIMLGVEAHNIAERYKKLGVDIDLVAILANENIDVNQLGLPLIKQICDLIKEGLIIIE